MKKTFALLMALAMMVTCFVGFAVNSSAALEYVEETYSYNAALDEYGTHGEEGEVEIDDLGSYTYEEFLFCDGLWTYEYWDPDNETFEPMTAYFAENQSGWVHGVWANIYTVSADSAWSSSPFSYCSIMQNGKYLHPGSGAGAVLTFIVPASGTITYDASIYAYSGGNTEEAQPETWGDYVGLFVNDEQVWPANGDSDENKIGYHNSSSSDPLVINYPSFKVQAGDRIRLRVTAAGGNNGSKGTSLVQMPTITYHEAGSLPVGNPNGTAPTGILAECPKNTLNCDVSWAEAKNAVGYNIYLTKDGETESVKVNGDTPITGTSYTIENLDPNTLYQLTMTTVVKSGNESAPSDPVAFKSRKAPDAGKEDKPAASDKEEDKTPASTDAAPAPSDKGGNEGGSNLGLIIGIAVGAVVLVAVVVVVIVIVAKKKKVAAPAAEAEAAPAEETKDAE